MTPKTKLEIIDETVAYYSEDVGRRATVSDPSGYEKCEYLTPDGRMCAVGRCETDPPIFNTSCAAGRVASETIVFKPEYEGHEGTFWDDLQYLHDSELHWTADGLSESGQSYVTTLKAKYA